MSRSFLFVPADSERKLAKAASVGADALILDLEDSVQSEQRPAARAQAAAFLKSGTGGEVWVRINPLGTTDATEDLLHVVPQAPYGIVLPKPPRARALRELADILDDLEAKHDLPPGRIRILPIATEVPAALFHMHEYAGVSPRLAAMSWGAEDLSAALGASVCRDADGRWLPPYELARSLCLFAASAAGVAAIDTVFTDFANLDALAAFANRGRRDGFEGMLAIHPAQVAVINEAYLPAPAELARARQIVALFSGNPGAGVLSLGGEMLDRPHLDQAKRLLDTAARFKNTSH